MSLSHRFQREDQEAAAQASFALFWSIYPRRVAKRAALKEWEREVRAGTDPAEIIAGLRRQLPMLLRKEPQFIPHARTWLHQGRWEDEPEAAPKPRNYADTLRSMFDGPAVANDLLN